jgi:hypothetical protein
VPWFNVDDGFAFHQKTVRAGNAALGLWTRAGAWCSQHLSDGFLPDEMAGVLGSATQAKKLVEVGLWVKVEGGYQFHEWVGWQRSRGEVLAERAYNARKAALYRDPELLAAVRKRDGDRCRYCGCLVNWKDRRGSSGATYDHVDPDGPNTLDNLVIACRGCNSRKAGRTPANAGLTLLSPKRMGYSGDPAGREPSEPERSGSDPVGEQNGTGTSQVPIPSNPIQPLSEQKTSSSAPRKRGSRIPDDFTVTADMVAWAREHAPNVDGRRATDSFIDYWRGRTGRDATKADWPATWRNWMRREQERTERSRPQSKANATDANIHALLNPNASTPALRALPGGAS